MTIQALSFKANDDQVQKKNYMPAAGAAAVVTTGVGGLGGYTLTKLNEDTFIKAAILDQENSATKEIAQGEKQVAELLGSEASESLKANNEKLSLRQKLDVADTELKKVAEWNDGKAVKLESAGKEEFEKAVKAQKEAYEALLKVAGDEKNMLSEVEFKNIGEQIKKDAIAKLTEDNKKTVATLEESISKAKANLREVDAHKKFVPEGEAKLSELATKFKNIFNPKEASQRAEDAEKMVTKFTVAAKKANAIKFAIVGAAVGVAALAGAFFANKSDKAEKM